MKSISKILFLITLSLCAFVPLYLAKAAITNSSRVIPYQGRLTDSSGNNVADGTYSMTFKIYTVSTGGSASFTETNSSVSVSSGLFSVLLGSLSANGVNLDFANPPYYLGITVGANSEMTPRIQLGFAPLAHNSQYLDGTPLSSFQLNTGVLTGAAGTNTRLQATGTGTGSTGSGSIYFLDSSGDTVGRYDTTTTTSNYTGTGNDGSVTITTTKNINTQTIAAGRSYADGIAYRVIAPADSATEVTRYSGSDTLSNGIASGDEVLLINLQGGNTDFADAGNYEFMKVTGATASTITFAKAITKSFDGTSAGNQKVVIQRIPQYTDVTLSGSGSLTASSWDGLSTTPTGAAGYYTALVAFRSSGTLTVGSGTSITTTGLGYRGGTTSAGYTAGSGGEAHCGSGGGASSGSGAAGGGGMYATGGTGYCGGGGGTGGGNGYSQAGGTGSSGVGGAGGGGAYIHSGAGGGGYGSAGGGGGGQNASGSGGGTNSSGNGGASGTGDTGSSGGAGGGGTYGSATLSQIFMGAAGGAGSSFGGGQGGAGGRGGGIIFVSAGTVSISGSISSNGNNGGGEGGGACAGHCSGGGGGAGGSIFIAGGSLTVGTSIVTASSSSGGSGYSSGGGGTGRIRFEYATSLSGSSSPAASTQASVSTGVASTLVKGYSTLYLGATNTSSADLAEYYVTGDKTLEAGDVVTINANPNDQIPSSKGLLYKASKPYDAKLVGVISTNPGVVLGSIDGDTGKSDKRQLALAGRVPVKIDPDSEPINVGDFLTSSSKPGYAKKATESGYVIGKALENWSGQPTIEVFINLIYTNKQKDEDQDAQIRNLQKQIDELRRLK